MYKDFNRALAIWITSHVGTMECAYAFAVIGISGVVFALTGDAKLTLIVGSISGYFLQLVLLPIIMVGQQYQGEKTRQHLTTHLAAHHASLEEKIKRLVKGV